MKERRTYFEPHVFIRSRRQVTTVGITNTNIASSYVEARTIYRYPWKKRLLGMNTAEHRQLMLRLEKESKNTSLGLFHRSNESLRMYYMVRQFIYFFNARNPQVTQGSYYQRSRNLTKTQAQTAPIYQYNDYYYLREVFQLSDKYLSLIIAVPGLIFPSLRTLSLGETQHPSPIFAILELSLVCLRVMSLVAQIYVEIHIIIITRLLFVSLDLMTSKPIYTPLFPPPPPLQEYRKHRYKHRYNKYGYKYFHGYVYGYGSGRGYSVLG